MDKLTPVSLIRNWAVRRQIQRSSHQALQTIPWPAAARSEEPPMPPAATLPPPPQKATPTRDPEPPAATTLNLEPAAAADELAPQHPSPVESVDPARVDELAPPNLKPPPPNEQAAATTAQQEPWELPQWRYRTRRARKSQRQQHK